MTMFRKLNFWPLPKAPEDWDPKHWAGACAIHVSNSHTKSGWILKRNDPQHPQVPPLGMTQAAEWKSRLICYIYFICEKIHKVWFKKLWNWLCNSDLMIFDLLVPPQGPRGRWPKKWCCCMWHSCKYRTRQIWLNFEEKNWPPIPHGTPKSHSWGMTQAAKWKSRLICFISFISEKTHKVWLKILWNWLCNWILMCLMILDLLAPPQGTRGGGPKQNVPLRAPFMWATHTPNLVGFRPIF